MQVAKDMRCYLSTVFLKCYARCESALKYLNRVELFLSFTKCVCYIRGLEKIQGKCFSGLNIDTL